MMAIPGYDPEDIERFRLERARQDGTDGQVSVVAENVPDAFGLEDSDADPPAEALSEPVEVVGLEDARGIEAIEITLEYDPSGLPQGASPTDVAVLLSTGEEWERVHSEVDLEATQVSALLTETPPGETAVAVHDTSGVGVEDGA